MSLYLLKDQELPAAHQKCVVWLRARLDSGASYAGLAQEIGIHESALKQFLRRASLAESEGEAVGHRRGAAFERIYLHYVENFEHAIPDNRELDDGKKYFFYKNFQKMLGVKASDNFAAAEKIFQRERFYCFRNANNADYIVISEINFRKISPENEDPIWEFDHHFDDNDGQKKSDGLAFGLHKCVYLFGDIQLGEGLDIIRIGEPQKKNSTFLIGFMESIDDQWDPFLAKIVLIPADVIEDSEKFKSTLPLDSQGVGIILKSTVEDFELVGFSHFGKKLILQLNFAANESTVKMRKTFLIPGDLPGQMEASQSSKGSVS